MQAAERFQQNKLQLKKHFQPNLLARSSTQSRDVHTKNFKARNQNRNILIANQLASSPAA